MAFQVRGDSRNPEGIRGYHDHHAVVGIKDRTAVVYQRPQALIGTRGFGRFHIHRNRDRTAGSHRLGQVDRGRRVHAGAGGKGQFVIGVPGAGTGILEGPGLGETLAPR